MDRLQVIPLHVFTTQTKAGAIERLIDEVALHLLTKLKRYHAPTWEHSLRVAELVRDLATSAAWSSEDVRKLTRAALLHDLGKVAVPLDILEKPGDLTEQEWSFMDQHGPIGADMVGGTRLLEDEAHIIRNHHRWFASNSSLKVDYHPLRDGGIDVVAVCDAYDAMVSERPYSSGRASEEAFEQLDSCAGDQFCPGVVSQFRDMMHARTHTLRFSGSVHLS